MINGLSFNKLLLAVVIILMLVLLLTVGVLYYSFAKYKTIRDKQNWTAVIQDYLSKAIVYGLDDVQESMQFTYLIEQKAFRNLFLATLVTSTRRFSGIASKELIQIFNKYNLAKDALQKLKSTKNRLIAGGIQELTAMEYQESLPTIETFLEHKDQMVYQEAQYSAVHFKGFDGLKFLNNFEHSLSDWQQIRLLSSLKKIEHTHSINNWLKSENVSVVVFSLRMIRKFQLLEFYSHVKELMNHSNEKIKLEAIKTIQKIENSNTIFDLIQAFKNQSTKVQLQIMLALKATQNKKIIDFMMFQLFQHPSITLRIIAAETLFRLGKKDTLTALRSSSDTTLTQIVKHALQQKVW